jgi:glycosyltransferase involved in cell wall biosynthesis
MNAPLDKPMESATAAATTSQAGPLADSAAERIALRVGINGIPLLSPATGIGQYTRHLAIELGKRLVEPPTLFYGPGWTESVRSASLPGVSTARAAIRRIPGAIPCARALMQYRFSSGARAERVELYHEPAFLAWRFRGPTVVTVHDLSIVHYAHTHPAERVRRMEQLLPGSVARANHIVVDSEFVRGEVISHFGISPAKVTTTLLGVSPDFAPRTGAECAAALREYDLEPGKYLLTVGTIEPRKNLQTTLSAFSRLPAELRRQYPLVIAGMPGWGESPMGDAFAALRDKGEIRLVGYVPQHVLPLLYAGACAFAYPSLYEGFGLPPLEAMASGVPVIVSDRSSLPEVVGDAGVKLSPDDVEGMTEHLQRFIEDADARNAAIAAGLVQAAKFTWAACAEETLRAYKLALSR